MKKKTILRILAAASAVALLLGGIYLLTKDDVRQKLKETDLKPYMPTPSVLAALDEVSEPEITTISETTTTITGEATESTTEAAVITTASPKLSAEVRQSLIDSAQSLNSAYPDALGWLYIPDTVISYPVMQSRDNDYYLNRQRYI